MSMRTAAPLALSVFFVANGADASSAFASQIPALPAGCNTCHVEGGSSDLNAFGQDVETTLRGTIVQWSSLFNVDSDGDGQTNGQELGDPCGEWTGVGDPGRTEDVSAPGDEDSSSLDPETGCLSDQMPWLEPTPRPRPSSVITTQTDDFFGGVGCDAAPVGAGANGVEIAFAAIAALGLRAFRRRR